MKILRISDLKNIDSGLTIKEDNLLKKHNIEIGQLVEVIKDNEYPSKYDNIRLYVIGHHRDCDGTPLYAIGLKGAEMYDNNKYFRGAKPKAFFNPEVVTGMDENSLRII